MYSRQAAKLVKKKKKYDHVRPLLIDLHWFPFRFRIDYKIALLCFKIINNLAPIYLKNMLCIYQPKRSLRSSHDKFILEKPTPSLTSYGSRSFSHYGPFIWNSLPYEIRSLDNINSFKRKLKHHFFLKAFNDQRVCSV